MLFTPVTSSNIKSAGWHQRTLFLHFNNGRTYSYADVPQAAYNDLVGAESVGKHFHAYIKNAFIAKELAPAVAEDLGFV
jgi:hypothetical protein